MGLDWCLTENRDGESPYKTAGCPQVGPETKERFAKLVSCKTPEEFETIYQMSLGDYLPLEDGYHEGLPAVTGMLGTVGFFDFRGDVIGNMEALGEDITTRAYSDFVPEEMLNYANDLENRLNDSHNEVHFKNHETVKGAIKWLRYWGSRGHGISAWS